MRYTHVKPHYRNGRRVRGHQRRIRPAAPAIGLGWLIAVVAVLAILFH